MWSFFSRDPTKDFPYEIGEPVSGLNDKSVWSLHKGKKRATQEEVSVFLFDVQKSSDTQLEVAKSALKKLKTLRHPSLMHFLDSSESDKVLYIATEAVEPLSVYLNQLTLEGQQKDLYLAWGLFQITVNISLISLI